MNLPRSMPWLNNRIHPEFRQTLRFALVGVLNTGASYILFVLLYQLLGYYIAASVLAYLGGMLISFMLNRGFVFKSTARRGQLLPFCLVNLSSLACSTGMLYLFVEQLAMFVYFAQVIAIGVSMTINYLGYRTVFSSRRTNDK
ncbi:GtrA family protein [Vibrio gazogenes]|uniref:Putative flippase GtrA (Transmembrane translocase of bactoprenol-linked glucose) n=1 Tax=Vibrio gazogenes DSM 21264 = NBRC 103151 TaxID=1123492 RepID=A0A1M5ANH9_VIBGA|nr:GtrA family protein [Vibrio gazogenes]USP12654.1 GtrA family protein [Vibrio gazogenes]SHF31818.1 Putative flippase GtrA (transmembrane translocase of bactoprenol-linked glucose) [Vibrio gazogenes DSM 21264] [Vibrio gazogenes DSM 21264 = NBRC 103151]SJN57760.1 GtrA-like protein [Vibrio gazogenes]